jgi:hypothetical protein
VQILPHKEKCLHQLNASCLEKTGEHERLSPFEEPRSVDIAAIRDLRVVAAECEDEIDESQPGKITVRCLFAPNIFTKPQSPIP